MPSPSTRVCIIGFERQDEAVVRFDQEHAAAAGMAHQVVDVPGCASLTHKIFEAAALNPELVSLGQIRRTRRIELDFAKSEKADKTEHLRPRQWTAGKTRPNHWAPQAISGHCAAMVAQLRWSDARAKFPGSGFKTEDGLDSFCRQVHTYQKAATTDAMFYLLGILPGPSWAPRYRLASLVRASKAPAKILFTDAKAFRDSGYRVREDGSTSAAVEDLCGAVLAPQSGPPSPNLTASDRRVAGRFFQQFSQIYIRIRCDAMLVFTARDRPGVTRPAGAADDPASPATASKGEWKVDLYYVIEGDRQAWFRYGEHIFGLNAIIAAVLITDRYRFSASPTMAPDAIREGLARAWSLVGRGYSIDAEPKNWEAAADLPLPAAWKLWDPLGNEKGEWSPEAIKEWREKKNRVEPRPGTEEHDYVDRRAHLIGLRLDVTHGDTIQHWELAEHLLYEVQRRVGVLAIPVGARANIRYRNRWTFFREVTVDIQTRVHGKSEAALWRDLPNAIARHGPEKARARKGSELLEWPYRVFRLGRVQSVDREEIDGLISLQSLIFTHLRACQHGENRPDHPLCVGVFGAPGSGKSFGVKQIAESLHKWGQPVPEHPVEFNVAQFTSRDDLATALHKIRDQRLETNKFPVAIFDEFDATFEGRPFGWLGHFLMPMHDGKFVDRKDTFHTGNAIFIFAGGINHSFGEFSSRQRDRSFCEAKGPDFISRLRGIHNVPPLNRPANFQKGSFPNWKIRRAILLHDSLRKYDVAIADDALLHAFLEVTAYHHGARSLGALIEMCARHHGKVIGRASLPPRDQLDLHVDAQEFWDLLRKSVEP